MKILLSIVLLGLIGFTVSSFAEEMYPILGVPNEVTVDLDNFENSKTVIFNLEFTDIEWVSASTWNNTEYHLEVGYMDNGYPYVVDMLKSQLAPLDGAKIDINNERYGKDGLSFEFTNLYDIIPENQDDVTLKLELYSDEIQSGYTDDDGYDGSFDVYAVDGRNFDFILPEIAEPTPIETVNPTDNVQTTLSTEEQMKLQQQQAIEQAEKAKQQRELEAQQEMELQKEQERITHELEQKMIAEEESIEIIETVDPIPEPMEMPADVEEAEGMMKCGAGTILVDGHCQIIVDDTESTTPPVKEEKGFFEWLMSLFGM